MRCVASHLLPLSAEDTHSVSFLPRDAEHAERGIATASRLSVCVSVTLRYQYES